MALPTCQGGSALSGPDRRFAVLLRTTPDTASQESVAARDAETTPENPGPAIPFS